MKTILKLSVLFAALTAILLTGGFFIGGVDGVIFALILAILGDIFLYFASGWIFTTFTHAVEIREEDMPWLHEMLGEISQKSGLPKPKLYLINDFHPNACATGRDKKHAIVAVTSGLLQNLAKNEIKAVLGHELGHIRSHDILISTIAAMIGSAVSILSYIGYIAISSYRRDSSERIDNLILTTTFIIIAPILAAIVRLAISRSREYNADRIGAELAGTEYMIDALLKLESLTKQMSAGKCSPSTAHMYIINPLDTGLLKKLLSTHPSTEDRVKRLRELSVERKDWYESI